MATTINSGYANSPKLTANIADYANVHGGKALVFDGATDYLDCGNGSELQITGAMTISLWAKLDSSASDGTLYIMAGKDASYKGWNLQRSTANKIVFYAETGTPSNLSDIATSSSTITDSNWHHYVGVFHGDGSTQSKIYIDGSDVTTNSGSTFSTMTDSAGSMHIGKSPRQTTYGWLGSLSDVKIFNTALTEAQVTELYRKPENTPSAVQDNLVAWYPMCEGNPESPQSIVYDHSEKKLGSELITASLDTGSGITSSSYITYDGKMNINAGGQDFYIQINNNADTSSEGFRYRLVVTVDSYTSGSMTMAGGSAGFVPFAITDSFNDIIAPDSNGGSFQFRVQNYVGVISSISLKKIEMGNHATTNFFGSELNPNPTFSNFTGNVPDGWGVVGDDDSGNNISQGSAGGLRLQSDGGSIFAHLADVNVVGKTYQFSITITNVNDDDFSLKTLGTKFFDGEGKSAGTYTGTYVAETTYVRIFRDDSCDVEITALSIKEVGISSSGFDTAVNEPVIPQVPLMRYNQKMLFDGVDDKVALGSTMTIAPSGGQGSISAVVNISEVDDTYRMIIGGTHPNLFAYMGYYYGNFKWLIDGAWNTSSATITAGKTYHIVGTWNNTSYKFYVNGVLDWSITDAAMLADFNTIGDSPNYEELRGIADEVSAWNIELSSTEVEELFNDGVALDATAHSKVDNLVGYWRNDGVSTWTDRSNFQAVKLNGSNQYIKNESFTAHQQDTGTLSVWVKFGDISGYQYVAGVGGNTSTGTNRVITLLNENLRFSGYSADFDTGANVSANIWYHIVLIWNGTSVTFYLNGTAYTNTQSNLVTPTGTNFVVGAYPAGFGTPTHGDFGSVAYWNKVLSQSEISDIYNLGRKGDIANSYSTNLQLWWQMNPDASSSPDTSSTIYDRSTNSNNGTMVNSPILFGTNDGTVAGSPESIIIREGLNSNKDGLGFPFRFDNSNVLRLDGVNDFVEIDYPAIGEQINSGIYTFDFWVKHNRENNGLTETYICLRDNDNHGNRFKIQKISVVDNTSYPILRYTVEGGGNITYNSSHVDTLDEGDWFYIAFVSSGVSSRQFYYAKSGADSLTAVTANTSTYGNTNVWDEIHIGQKREGAGALGLEMLDGIIDEVRYYSKALSSTELLKNYKHGKGKHKNS